MKRIKAYYTVETTLVMGVIIFMIFSAVTYTLELYEKVEAFGTACVAETKNCGATSDLMRLERLMGGFDQ
ncbi:MAG: hypothetical protein K6F63_08565 [Lachnospiraceae bacterium]|nr:hypothetical protein [Lachnospiraceae bacterium]